MKSSCIHINSEEKHHVKKRLKRLHNEYVKFLTNATPVKGELLASPASSARPRRATRLLIVLFLSYQLFFGCRTYLQSCREIKWLMWLFVLFSFLILNISIILKLTLAVITTLICMAD